MAAKEKVEFLRRCLTQQIEGFGQRRQETRRMAFRLRIGVVTCGAITTILLGLHSLPTSWQPVLKDLALISSALVTFIGAIDAFYNYRALWVRYTVTYTNLRAIEANLDYLTVGGLDQVSDANVDRLFKQFQLVLDETNANWRQLKNETEVKQEA